MKRLLVVLAVIVSGLVVAGNSGADIKNRIGIGANYWKNLDDIDVKDFDDSGLSYYLSYQLIPASLLKFELDVEMMQDGYAGSDDTVFSPQGFIILGAGIYAGLGIGTYYTDGDFSSDPFFTLRAGLDIHVLPYIWLDVNANYRFEDWNDISDVTDDVSTDTIMLGAAVRLQF